MKLKVSNYTLAYKKDDGSVILANTLSGAAMYLSKSQFLAYGKLVGSEYEEENGGSLPRALIKGKFVCNESFDELLYLKNKYLASKYGSSVLELTIIPTLECNFSCPYCFVDKQPGKMSREVQDDIIRYVSRRIGGIEALRISYFGGEPLLAMDEIENLSKKLKILPDYPQASANFSNRTGMGGVLAAI